MSNSTNLDEKIFGNKKFSDLLKEIHTNSKNKEKKINELIESIQPHIVDLQSAIMMVPLLANYLNIGVKNDEQLIKLAAIVQRALTTPTATEGDSILTEDEKKELIKLSKEASNIIPFKEVMTK